jgi:hypothetical protein
LSRLLGERDRLTGLLRPTRVGVLTAKERESRRHGRTTCRPKCLRLAWAKGDQPGPGQRRYRFCPPVRRSHSSARERARRAASRARSASRCSFAASPLRPACSCLLACSSASAALASSTSAVRIRVDDRRSTLFGVRLSSRPKHSAARSAGSRRIPLPMMAPVARAVPAATLGRVKLRRRSSSGAPACRRREPTAIEYPDLRGLQRGATPCGETLGAPSHWMHLRQ